MVVVGPISGSSGSCGHLPIPCERPSILQGILPRLGEVRRGNLLGVRQVGDSADQREYVAEITWYLTARIGIRTVCNHRRYSGVCVLERAYVDIAPDARS